METIGDRIKQTRLKLGLSQVDFARMIGVTKQTLYKYENNLISNIPFGKIEMAATAGNVTPSYLMGWPSEYDPDWRQSREECKREQGTEEERRFSEYSQIMKMVYHQLNEAGQDHLIQTAKDMTQIERFRKGTASQKGKTIS